MEERLEDYEIWRITWDWRKVLEGPVTKEQIEEFKRVCGRVNLDSNYVARMIRNSPRVQETEIFISPMNNNSYRSL